MKSTKQVLISILISSTIFGAVIYFGNFAFPDPDGFYHAKVSQLLQTNEITHKFEWLPFASWGESYANQHYIYHLILTPFNTIELLPFSIILFAAASATVFAFILIKLNIRLWWFWLLLYLFGSADFLFRISLVKANTLSLVALFAFVWLLAKYTSSTEKKALSKYLTGTAIIGGLFFGLYGGFVFLLLLAAIYFMVELVISKKIAWFLPFGIFVGLAIGLFFHPQNNALLLHLYDQIFHTGLGAGAIVPAGGEWLQYDLAWFLRSNFALLLLFSMAIAVFTSDLKNKLRGLKESKLELSVLLFCIALLFLTLMYRRFIEYFAPFSILYTALVFKPYLQKINWRGIKLSLKSYQGVIALSFSLLMILSSWAFNLNEAVKSFQNQPSGYEYKESSKWMQANSEQGEIIFNTQWDEFPQLFYWNHYNYYIVGMDPTFFYIANPELYWQWRKVSDDDIVDSVLLTTIHDVVKKDFNSKFLFIDKSRNPNLWKKIVNEDLTSEYFTVGHEDDLAIVFRVN